MIEWGIEGSNFRWHQFQIGKTLEMAMLGDE
jgi:hypothetical protein